MAGGSPPGSLYRKLETACDVVLLELLPCTLARAGVPLVLTAPRNMLWLFHPLTVTHTLDSPPWPGTHPTQTLVPRVLGAWRSLGFTDCTSGILPILDFISVLVKDVKYVE